MFRATTLQMMKNDLLTIFDAVPHVMPCIARRLLSGEIDGRNIDGTHVCLLANIARELKTDYFLLRQVNPSLAGTYIPICGGSYRPAERLFEKIHRGHTPVNSKYARFAHQCILEWARDAKMNLEQEWHQL